MFEILLTCPPMLKQAHRYKDLFTEYNLKVDCLNINQIMTEEELCQIIHKYDGWIIGDDPATRKVFKTGKDGKLKAVVKWGVGTDNVDFDACRELGIPISNIPGVFGEEVSDIAIGYLLCLTRKLHIINEGHKYNKWLKPTGESLTGKKICLIGFGDIGRAIARKLLAFKLDVWVSDPAFSKSVVDGLIKAGYGAGNQLIDIDILQELQAVNIDKLDKCLENANYVICACPLNEYTFHLLNRENILKCKNGVKIINVARGSVIKEQDICELLETGFIDSIAFDVFEEEPLAPENKLRNYKQNIFGSHNGSNTLEAVDKVSKIAVEKMNEFLHP
jgi:D-3-phosphoglycerate dehydrogenase / 2-oxoglutarate reductase